MIGGKEMLGDTLWVDVGCDQARVQYFEMIERALGVSLSDDDREGVMTIRDLTGLLERRAHA